MSKKAGKISSVQGFSEGDFVVYPAHGVGRITGFEQHSIGDGLQLVAIEFKQDRMVVKVPVDKLERLGLRKLSSRDRMRSAIVTLKGTPQIRRAMWSRRAQEYETKINSGDPVSIAEVVRDLFRKADQPEQSYSERQMYQAALERLVREYAAVESLDEDKAARKLETLLQEPA